KAVWADADVLAVREPNPGSGAVAESGVASADGAGVEGAEEVAGKRADAERIVPRSARQTGQEAECRVAPAGVPRHQPDHRGGGRPTADACHPLDWPATDPAGSLGVPVGPVSASHGSNS